MRPGQNIQRVVGHLVQVHPDLLQNTCRGVAVLSAVLRLEACEVKMGNQWETPKTCDRNGE